MSLFGWLNPKKEPTIEKPIEVESVKIVEKPVTAKVNTATGAQIKAPVITAFHRPPPRKIWNGVPQHMYMATTPECHTLHYRGKLGKNDDPNSYADKMWQHKLRGAFVSAWIGDKINDEVNFTLMNKVRGERYGWIST